MRPENTLVKTEELSCTNYAANEIEDLIAYKFPP